MSKAAVARRQTEISTLQDESVASKNADLKLTAAIVEDDRPEYSRAEAAHSEIQRLAYSLWEEGGRRDGTAEEDWFRAEAILRGADENSATA